METMKLAKSNNRRIQPYRRADWEPMSAGMPNDIGYRSGKPQTGPTIRSFCDERVRLSQLERK